MHQYHAYTGKQSIVYCTYNQTYVTQGNENAGHWSVFELTECTHTRYGYLFEERIVLSIGSTNLGPNDPHY